MIFFIANTTRSIGYFSENYKHQWFIFDWVSYVGFIIIIYYDVTFVTVSPVLCDEGDGVPLK